MIGVDAQSAAGERTMSTQKSRLAQSKIFGTAAILLGVFGFLVIIHRLSHYIYEYDAEFSPVITAGSTSFPSSPYSPTCSSMSISSRRGLPPSA